MKIGNTFDCVSCKPCDVLPAEQCSDIVKEPVTTYNWNIIEVKNKKSLHAAFGFKNTMSLKVSAGQINADSMVSFERSLSDESDKTWLMFDCKYETMKETLPSKPSRDEHGNYGTHYVRSLVRGGKVLILCQLSSNKSIQSCKNKLDQATAFSVAANQKLSLDQNASSQSQDDFVNIHFYSSVRTTKQPTTSSEVYSFIRTFREELDKETNFEPVQFELCPFEIGNSEDYTCNFKEFYESYEDALDTDRNFSEFINSDTISKLDENGRKLMHRYRRKVQEILSGLNETVFKANMERLGTDAGMSLKDYKDFINDNATEALSMKTLFDKLKVKLSGGVDRLERLLPTTTKVPLHDLTVLVVGHTGSGKTALVQFLVTGRLDGGSRSTESGTEKFEKVETVFEDKKITYLDTPGFYDTNSDKKSLSIEEIKKAFEAARSGCEIVLFVVNVQHSKWKTQKVFNDLKYYHGTDIVKHMIVVFTFVEAQKEKKVDLDRLKNDKKWKDTLAECGNRAIGIDSAEMTTQQEHHQVLKCLSTMMNRLYLDNDNKAYMPPPQSWWCTVL